MVKKAPTQAELLTKNGEQEEKPNVITQIKNALFQALYVSKNKQKTNNYKFQCSDWENIINFITESIVNLEWDKFTRVEWENNNLFYIFTKNQYDTIEKFYIEENWKKELIKTMFWIVINYKWKKYTRVETVENWFFYIDIKTHKKL